MRPVSFGKVVVATAGTPVQLGVSTLAANIGAGDTVLTVSNAGVFSPDMCPFVLTMDSGGALEKVEVVSMTSATFTVTRGQGGTTAIAHSAGALTAANDFRIAGFLASTPDTNTGKAWLGTRLMAVGDGAGTLKKFAVTATGATDDSLNVMLNSDSGDPSTITEFRIDTAVSGEAVRFSAWVR